MKSWTAVKLTRLNARINHNWQKLTDEEIAFYQESPDIFYDAVKQKYGMFKNDVERRMKQLKVRRYFFNW